MSQSSMTPEEYLKKPYSRTIIPDEDTGTYTAQIHEFPGCIAEGKTVRQAYERLEKAAVGWIQAALDMGQDIPLPAAENQYGGKIALRLPKSLHRQVALAAERDETSVNQFIVMAVAEKVGAAKSEDRLADRLENPLSAPNISVVYVQAPDTNHFLPRILDGSTSTSYRIEPRAVDIVKVAGTSFAEEHN